MLEFAVFKVSGPVAVRYPRGGEGHYRAGGVSPSKVPRMGTDITIVTYGLMINTAMKAAELLNRRGVSAEILKLDFISPLDMRGIIKSVAKTGRMLAVSYTHLQSKWRREGAGHAYFENKHRTNPG